MPKEITENVKINLDDLMIRNYMDIEKLHQKSGLSRTIISQLKNGESRDIRLKTIEKLCRSLDCEIGELIELKK